MGCGKDAARTRLIAAPATASGRDVFVYFDNDAKVHAPFDAMSLAHQLKLGDAPPAGPDFSRIKEGARKCDPVLLEPIMKLDIVTPEEYLGDFVGDLQQRRALIAKTDQRGKMSTIEAHAPLKELFGYSSAMRSLSQGRAGASIEPLRYDPAPPEVLKAFEI